MEDKETGIRRGRQGQGENETIIRETGDRKRETGEEDREREKGSDTRRRSHREGDSEREGEEDKETGIGRQCRDRETGRGRHGEGDRKSG